MPYIILLIYLAIALALQLLTGDFPVYFFAFPLNLILALIWAGSMIWLWKTRRKSLFVSFLLSRGASIWAISIFLLFCLFIGLTGMRRIVGTWVFVAFILYFQTVLLFVILRGWRAQTATGAHLGKIRLRFMLNHAGILLAVASACWGAPDTQTLGLRAVRDVPVREAFRKEDGQSAWLPYEIELTDFKVETYENGVPAMYEADVLIDGEPVTLKVNHPYSKGFGKNIYLTGYDASAGEDSEYCIIQVVSEPWKYGAVTGIVLMLAGALLLFAAGPKKRYGEEDD